MSDAEMPDLCRDSDSDNSDVWGEEDDTDEMPTLCLFCENSSKSIEYAVIHVEREHQFNFQDLQIKFNMDQYAFIKMVNYIRVNRSSPEQIQQLTSCPWDEEKYLKPTDESRMEWLMFDFEDQFNSTTAKKANKDTTMVSISQLELNEMKNTTRNLSAEVKHLNSLLEDMRKEFKSNSEKLISELEKDTTTEVQPKSVAAVKVADDEMYFSSYAHYDIHHEMLSDTVRTKSYEQAILKNSETLTGKTVLDLGCGSGILSMFCSRAGAAQVISIDQSEIIYKAMDICRANNITNVKMVKGRLEDTEIGVEKVDVIVSEWMGYFLLFEGMMDSLIYARDHHLKEGGLLLPSRCNMSLVAWGDEDRHTDLIGFWDSVYGFDMKCMKKEVLKDASIEVCNPKWILSEANVIADIDLMTATIDSCNFKYDFKLKVVKEGKVTAFVGYFDTFFELPNHVEFSTGPEATPTHWKQTAFYLQDPVAVTEGQIIEGTLKCRRHAKEVRSLSVTITVFGQKNKYTIN